ncbi:vacuole membrane protein KMS1 isoform X1 [Amborella trichopoda]|nr:vacuole membrane protein KMS1 isoform X1 [Amborella trichopoda]|eukprot:XP_006838257.2 vacuole membrane protein KMS1 isoform X1 [Amborella trichopoda]
MGSRKRASRSSGSTSSSEHTEESIAGLRKKHQMDLENLTLTKNPFKTLKLFFLATVQYLMQSIAYVFTKGVWLILLIILGVFFVLLLLTVNGPHEKHLQEALAYLRFGLWWVALGVASSIGLGSGLHTFVIYLGPHIAFFTRKAMQCGRVDLKSAPYDTIQLKRGPSWLIKDCSEYGPPIFPSLSDSLIRVPLSSILPQVQLEAILWGIGTALGELPPYFISRAAHMSGSKLEAMEELDKELDASSKGHDGIISAYLTKIKRRLLSHAQHLNFFSILVLASVPNPLFDLAGIMCGQFGIPFWEFFFATLIGKAIIKTHIQTVFIISICNNQLLEWVENELLWVLSLIPGMSSILPELLAKLHKMKDKYLTAPVASNIKGKRWDLSFTTIWNTFILLMLMNFFVKIVTATARKFLKEQQEREIALLTEEPLSKLSNGTTK